MPREKFDDVVNEGAGARDVAMTFVWRRTPHGRFVLVVVAFAKVYL